MHKHLFTAALAVTLLAGCGKKEGYVAPPTPQTNAQLRRAGQPFMVGDRFRVTYLSNSPAGTYWQLIEDTQSIHQVWLKTDAGMVQVGR